MHARRRQCLCPSPRHVQQSLKRAHMLREVPGIGDSPMRSRAKMAALPPRHMGPHRAAVRAGQEVSPVFARISLIRRVRCTERLKILKRRVGCSRSRGACDHHRACAADRSSPASEPWAIKPKASAPGRLPSSSSFLVSTRSERRPAESGVTANAPAVMMWAGVQQGGHDLAWLRFFTLYVQSRHS